MKRISGKKLKFTYINTTVFVMLGYFLLFGKICIFEETGENFFHISLNGQEIGTVSQPEEAEELLIEARKRIASEETELVLMEADLSYTGEEVLWGEVDDSETLIARMQEVLAASEKETMQRSYTVKVNEYMVNLGNIEEVKVLLQAAVDKYDTEDKFEVVLHQDLDREFGVLKAEIVKKEEQAEESEDTIFPEAGIQNDFTQAVEQAQPEVEKGFEDYELGILEISFPQEVEIVEVYLPQSRLTSLEQAIEEVTKEQETVTTYEVVSGDTLSEIAIKVNIPMEDLVAMNDSLESINSTLHIGDELIITVPEPELTVSRRKKAILRKFMMQTSFM